MDDPEPCAFGAVSLVAFVTWIFGPRYHQQVADGKEQKKKAVEKFTSREGLWTWG
jgi:hypothetical protein